MIVQAKHFPFSVAVLKKEKIAAHIVVFDTSDIVCVKILLSF